MTDKIPDVEETDCQKYEHIPECYDVSFYHCKVCGKELAFMSLEELTTLTAKHDADIEKAVEEARERIFKLIEDAFNATHRGDEILYDDLMAFFTPTKTDKQTSV